MSFLKKILKELDNPYASIASTGTINDVVTYTDTGCYILNALLSTSIYGGFSSNRVTGISGASGVGKSFIMVGFVDNFLKSNKDSIVVYFESEGAISKELLEQRGIDSARVIIIPVATVQEFKVQCMKVLDSYEQEENKHPLLICLDSLGNLSTTKEIEDTVSGKDVADMGHKAKMVKGVFRVLTLKLSKLNVPMVITNHTYQEIGKMYGGEVSSGGTGFVYACSTIINLTKRKEKDADNQVVGNIIHTKNVKNRLAKENMMVDCLLRYDTGLNKYYGLIDLAVEAGIWKKMSTRIELPDGKKMFEKAIYKDAETYFTKDVLDKIDAYTKEKFAYGSVAEEKENEE